LLPQLGIAAIGIAAVACLLDGAAGRAPLALLAVLALARSACSIAHKDVLGKTVAKSTRGTVNGTAVRIAGGAARRHRRRRHSAGGGGGGRGRAVRAAEAGSAAWPLHCDPRPVAGDDIEQLPVAAAGGRVEPLGLGIASPLSLPALVFVLTIAE